MRSSALRRERKRRCANKTAGRVRRADRCVAARARSAALHRAAYQAVFDRWACDQLPRPLRLPGVAPARGRGFGFIREGLARSPRNREARAGLHSGAYETGVRPPTAPGAAAKVAGIPAQTGSAHSCPVVGGACDGPCGQGRSSPSCRLVAARRARAGEQLDFNLRRSCSNCSALTRATAGAGPSPGPAKRAARAQWRMRADGRYSTACCRRSAGLRAHQWWPTPCSRRWPDGSSWPGWPRAGGPRAGLGRLVSASHGRLRCAGQVRRACAPARREWPHSVEGNCRRPSPHRAAGKP